MSGSRAGCGVRDAVGGNSHYQKAEFTEVSAPERVVWLHSNTDADWNVAPSPMMPNWPLALLTTVTFAVQGGQTALRLTWVPQGASEAEVAAFGSALGGLDQGLGRQHGAPQGTAGRAEGGVGGRREWRRWVWAEPTARSIRASSSVTPLPCSRMKSEASHTGELGHQHAAQARVLRAAAAGNRSLTMAGRRRPRRRCSSILSIPAAL